MSDVVKSGEVPLQEAPIPIPGPKPTGRQGPKPIVPPRPKPMGQPGVKPMAQQGPKPMGQQGLKIPMEYQLRVGLVCPCKCVYCRRFFVRGAPARPNDAPAVTPRSGYIGFVNKLRAAFAKRDEMHQEELRALREGVTGKSETPKKEKSAQPKKKSLRQKIKRRRQ